MTGELLPRSTPSAPRLTCGPEGVAVHHDGAVHRWPVSDGPGGAAVLATYSSRAPQVRRPMKGAPGPALRFGLRLESADGDVLAWLGHTDAQMYADHELQAFAGTSGLRLVDHGLMPHDELLAQAPRDTRVGPGTSPVARFVAPGRQWRLAGLLVGGAMLAFPWVVVGLEADPPSAVELLWGLVGLASLLPGPTIGPALGILLLVLVERWRSRRRALPGLRPDAPGVAVVPVRGDVLVLDPFDRHRLGGVDRVTVRPYDVTRSRWPQGLVVSAVGRPPLVVPGVFDPEAVRDFCGQYGITVGRAVTDEAGLPKLRLRARDDLRRHGGHTVRSISPWWVRLRWLPVLVAVLGLLAVAAGATGLLAPRLPVVISGAGALLVVLAGWVFARGECLAEFVRPELVPAPAAVR